MGALKRIRVLHGAVAADAPADDQDTLVQADAVAAALRGLGFEVERLALGLELGSVLTALEEGAPDLVFNLVEAVAGSGRLIHLGPSLLEEAGIPYTGAPLDALFLTSNKLIAKRLLRLAGIATPPWFLAAASPHPNPLATRGEETQRRMGNAPHPSSPADCRGHQRGGNSGNGRLGAGRAHHSSPGAIESSAHALVQSGPLLASDWPGRWIVKSVWEHGSIGMDDGAVAADLASAQTWLARAGRRGDWFAETYIEGREINIALLGGRDGPQALPPAEIRFDGYPPDKPRIVGYAAKWNPESFEYRHTPRVFLDRAVESALVARLEALAVACWRLFRVEGYARVDFRVDASGEPWVLEVNANPCLSPDAGLAAAAQQAGITYPELIRRIADDALMRAGLEEGGKAQ